MTTVTWLHLSDWHQKGKDFDRQVVRDALIKDIADRTAISPDLATVDFVVFSGDAAFRGEPEEFVAARQNLFDPVLNAVGLKPDRLFMVPGNHDLNRTTVYEMLPPALQKPLQSDAEVQPWLTDDRKRTRALEPFEAYRDFVAGYTGQASPDYASMRIFLCGDKQVALLGLNSAWMCARHEDDKGEVEDARYILVGEPQIHAALKQIEGANVRIAVLHHPFDWLVPFDRNHVESRLGRECHFVLRGHEHQPQVNIMHGSDGDRIVIPAGACYKRRIAEDPRYTNAYNWVHLDFETGQGMVYLRRWSDPRNAWIEDSDAYPGGKFLLPSLPKGLVKPTAGAKPVIAPVLLDTTRLAHVEDKYRRLLLETCDIISLVGLPEQDRHLAERELALRSLYIPLHTWVEVPVDETPDDSDIAGERFETLERSRDAARRGLGNEGGHQRERTPLGARLRQARRLVILGDPGAGKTTLTRWLATAYLLRLKGDPAWRDLPAVQTLPEADYLPIIIRCRDFKEDERCLNGALEDILAYTLRKAEFSPTETADLVTLLRARLEAGTALLMLDGLDEITDLQARACFCEQVERMAVAYKASIIVTSRIVGYREMGRRLGRAFEHLTLADLTPEEKDDFARRWCELTELPERWQEAAAEFIHDLHGSERIERLTSNPMLLTTMALVKRKVGKLPNRRADLYWEAVQVLLNWRREVDAPLDPREALPQLEYLAYAMCDRGVQRLRQDEVLALFTRMREEYPNIHAARARSPEDFLQYLEARTGIFIEAGYERDLGMEVPVYEFRHLTFQEYLAARALVDGRFPGRDAGKSLAEHLAPLAGRTEPVWSGDGLYTDVGVVESWREALRLCLAICQDDDVDPALRAILHPQEGEPAQTARARAIQAALCLADEPNASEPVVVGIMQAFAVQVGDEDGKGLVHTGMEQATMDLASTRWVESLRRTLLDEFCCRPVDTRNCVGGLVSMVVGATMPAAESDRGDWWGQQVERLYEGDEVEAIEVALEVMDIAFRRQAQVVPGLIEALLDRLLAGSAPMAHAAAWALAWLNGGPIPAEASVWDPTSDEKQRLLAFLYNQTSDPLAVYFLTWIIQRECIAEATQSLLFWLENPIADVRGAAAETLGQIGDATGIAPLITRLEDEDEDVRRAAVEVLERIGDATGIAPLITRLEDEDEDVRRAAVEVLERIGDPTAITPLIARLEDVNSDVRCAAVEALERIGDATAIAPLITRLEDKDPGVRRAAAAALGRIGDATAIAPLVARLEDKDSVVRRAAAAALGRIGDATGIAPLITRLEDKDSGVRRAAAAALGRIGDATAIAPLVARLEDKDSVVRGITVSALGKIGDTTAIAPLITCLGDGDLNVRRAAVQALDGLLYSQGRYGEAEAIWRRALAKDEKHADLWNRLGLYYQEAGRLIEAVEAHQQAVAFEPNRAAWQFSLAGALRQSGRTQEAGEHLALARATLDKEDDYNKACFEAIAGNTEAALEHLARALKESPNHAWAARDPDLIWLHGDPRFEALIAGTKPDEGAAQN